MRERMCVVWYVSVLIILADNNGLGLLERRKPIRVNCQGAVQRDTVVFHSNFTDNDPHPSERTESSGRWQPEGKEMGSDSGCDYFSPILPGLQTPLPQFLCFT